VDHQDLRTLRLLEAIESGESTSQRDIAKQLNISLGLVNSFTRRLARKGLFKVTHIPRNRVAYMLTPKGVAEKTRLTYAYIQFSYNFYRDARKRLKSLVSQLCERNVKRIVFWGATDLAEIAYLSIQDTPIGLVAVIDENRAGEKFLGLRVDSPERIENLNYDMILITNDSASEKLGSVLSKHGVVGDKVLLIK